MKNKLLPFAIFLLINGCVFDNESRMQYRFGQYIGRKFDLYEFINMSPAECEDRANLDIYRTQHNQPRGFAFFPWNPLNFRKNCGIHKISETSKTADYEITYYGTCKYIYTVEKKTDLILAWRYTKDSKNCVPGP